jgi:type IV protein arginine methyltransferase
MHGVYAEVLLNYVERNEEDGNGEEKEAGEEKERDDLHEKYLNSKLEYDDSAGVLLDEHGAPVMMRWETEIMQRTAGILLPTIGSGRVLNIGFGMGIIDSFLQERKPESHIIIEAHPAVIQRMKDQGWDKKPGVQVPLTMIFLM